MCTPGSRNLGATSEFCLLQSLSKSREGPAPQVEGKSVWKAEGRKEHGWRPPVAVGQERDAAVAGPRGSVVRVQGQPSCG